MAVMRAALAGAAILSAALLGGCNATTGVASGTMSAGAAAMASAGPIGSAGPITSGSLQDPRGPGQSPGLGQGNEVPHVFPVEHLCIFSQGL